MDIVAVAQQLGLDLKQKSNYYYWDEHDSFRIYPDRNNFYWWSRDTGGDVIQLVQTVQADLTGQAVPFRQAINYLRTGNFETIEARPIPKDEPFSYYLTKAETADRSKMRQYLRKERGLSDETIAFFERTGNLVKANYTHRQHDNLTEPIIVFKSRDLQGKLIGASLQGIEAHPEIHDRGRMKKIMARSDGLSGFSVDIGQPKRLVFAEAPIDMMFYYELHKDTLQDVRLVAMDGLKKGVISHYALALLSDGRASQTLSKQQLRANVDEVVSLTTLFKDGQHTDLITLAVDNDEAGLRFISRFSDDGIPVMVDIPIITQSQQSKMDWNDRLKENNPALSELQGYHLYYFNSTDKTNHYAGYLSSEVAQYHLENFLDREVPALISQEFLPLKALPKANLSDWTAHIQNYLNAASNKQIKSVDNSRLAQAQRKLDRLNQEFSEATSAVYAHTAQTNGQPMNDKRNGAAYFKKQNQLENKVFRTLDEIKQQEERVERLEQQAEFKAQGLNRQGTGLEMSVQNISRIREEIAKADRGESVYTAETIKRYRNQLKRLETMVDRSQTVSLSPQAQALVDEGLITQWQKQPTIYFVKGIRRVALELDDRGNLILSPRYAPRSDSDRQRLEELLSRLTLENKQKGQKTMADNEKELQVLFDFSENPIIASQYSEGDIIPYQDFSQFLLEQNLNRQLKEGYDKTYFYLLDENRERLTGQLRYDVGSEKEGFSQGLALERLLSEEYLALAQATELNVANIDSSKTVEPSQGVLFENLNDIRPNSAAEESAAISETIIQLQENLSMEGDLVVSSSVDSQTIYTNRVDFNQNYQLELSVYSPTMIEHLSDIQAPWSLAIIQREQKLGYLAYGEDWGNAFSIRKELQGLAEQISLGKSPEGLYQQVEVDTFLSERQKKTENKIGDLPDNYQKAAPLPEATESLPLNESSPTQTQSQSLLYFTLPEDQKSRYKSNYHPVTSKELRKLNRYAPQIQESALWYRENLANSEVIYFFQNDEDVEALNVTFQEEQFSHLVGIYAVADGQTASKTLNDLADGHGAFDGLMVANRSATFSKIQVLPDLKAIIESQAFVFNDLSKVRHLDKLNLNQAVQTEDNDLLLVFRTVDGTTFSASLMKVNQKLSTSLAKANQNTILGVFRNRNGQIEPLSINSNIIKDNDQELLNFLQQGQLEAIKKTRPKRSEALARL